MKDVTTSRAPSLYPAAPGTPQDTWPAEQRSGARVGQPGILERAFDRAAARLASSMLGRVGDDRIGVRLWNGHEVSLTGAPRHSVHFRSRAAFWRVLLDPEFQLPEGYANGTIDIEGDLGTFFDILLRTGAPRASLRTRASYVRDEAVRALFGSTAVRRARRHYDLPSEFYVLWLDQTMTYTCAYFPDAASTLEDAQRAKLELICEKLGIERGQHVVEAGGGWGSLALHIARDRGATVTAYNVSREQVRYARERAAREGVADRVRFVEDDYRNIDERCDAFVAVGMLEHVEPRAYAELGHIIDRCLEPGGLALIHTIARPRRLAPPRWTRRRIFPGGYMPALSEIMRVFEPNDLCVLDVESLRLHYAKTLEHWLARFEAASPRIAEMFGDTFVRTWRLYLASAAAGFRTGWLQLLQIVVTRASNNAIAWTRPLPPRR